MFFQESSAKVFTSHYSFYHQSIPRQFAQNRIKPNFISKDISINIVLNYFRQRPRSLAITGLPYFIASMATRPKASQRLGMTTASQAV